MSRAGDALALAGWLWVLAAAFTLGVTAEEKASPRGHAPGRPRGKAAWDRLIKGVIMYTIIGGLLGLPLVPLSESL